MTVKSINEDDQLYLPYRFFKVAAETSNFKANLSTEISNIVDEQSAKILLMINTTLKYCICLYKS